MNKAILIGHVGKDPEIRDANGKKVATFSLATTDGKDKTTWHNIVTWERTAELVEKYVKKGSHIAIQGRISNRSYDDKEGNKKYVTEIVADWIELLGSRPTDQPSQEPTQPPVQENGPADDLPF